MLHTFEAPFDFHAADGGRTAFREWASCYAERIEVETLVVDDPIFSYRSNGKDGIERLAALNPKIATVVYLSDIVMHSSILLIGPCDSLNVTAPIEYESLSALISSPKVKGCSASRIQNSAFTDGEAFLVISELYAFRNPDGSLNNSANTFRVLDLIDNIYFVNIVDYAGYLAKIQIDGDHAFFIDSDRNLDFHMLAKCFVDETLRNYLMSRSYPFITVGDDHIDDEFIVFYGMDVLIGNDKIKFMR